MRQASDTTLRFLAMLQLLPVYPSRISAREIKEKLYSKSTEFKVDIRTIQRDLEKLSSVFSISCAQEGRTNYWYWTDKHSLTQIPAMGQPTALAFKLASDYLKPIMPPETLKLLEPYFAHANRVLKGTKLGKWSSRARIISRGPVLIPPAIKKDVQRSIYQALLEGKQVQVDYRSRAEDEASRYTLNPLGIVFREGVIYLVATLWDYEEPMHFALHRMNKPELLNKATKRPTGFSLAEHIEDDREFSYPVTDKKIRLGLIISKGIVRHLQESRLSTDQIISRKKDGRHSLTASVYDTSDLRWWLLGLGSSVEIVRPVKLKNEMAAQIEEMRNIYQDP